MGVRFQGDPEWLVSQDLVRYIKRLAERRRRDQVDPGRVLRNVVGTISAVA